MQPGITRPAHRGQSSHSAYRAQPHAIFSSMSLRDDVLSGASYFMTEIRSVLRIVNYAGALPCLAYGALLYAAVA